MLIMFLLALATGIETSNVSPAHEGKSFPLINRHNQSVTFLSLVNNLHEDKYMITKKKVRRSASPNRDLGILNETCANSAHYKPDIPVKCYQCRSNISDQHKEPLCDGTYWKIIRHSEKAHMRVTCDEENGKFCMKVTRSKFKQRITERGCFGEVLFGPNGTIHPATAGCARYTKDGYLTRACLCDTNFCNVTPHLNATWNIVYVTLLSLLCNTF